MTQLTLDNGTTVHFPDFDGATYDPALDEDRLRTLLGRVYQYLRYGGWVTLHEVAECCGGSEAGVSARIRDLRKAKFGGYTIARRRVDGGLFEYRMETD